MNPVRRLFAASLATLALAATGAFAADANVTGEWTMTVETQAGTGSPHFSLKQEGTNVTGHYKGQLGEAPVTGTVKGNEVTLKYSVNAQGADLTVTYTGTVEGDTMKGKVSLGEFGDGTFTGKKG
ncbi:hypothetical protein HNQ60_002109 [Povalibacter uvarum]|uniref:Uncharacterized protein n=1 Tax=Povalibacter uvarum TaxID=732238 RepID=A0A841HJ42_9GAMM|nr:hypothetical protein [Povalibacter uvarum]MBB6093231.1 hypothetical protein [Povalibacter uvarum]